MALPVLRSRRILLRPWTIEDVDALHDFWTAPGVRRYLWDDEIITRDTARQVVDSHLATAAAHGIGQWALHIPPTGAPPGTPIAGFCGFRFIDDGPGIELLYGLHVEHWGKGLATEACLAALDYFWPCTEFPRVYARTDPPNERSVGVMRRLGMTHHSTTPLLITYLLQRTP